MFCHFFLTCFSDEKAAFSMFVHTKRCKKKIQVKYIRCIRYPCLSVDGSEIRLTTTGGMVLKPVPQQSTGEKNPLFRLSFESLQLLSSESRRVLVASCRCSVSPSKMAPHEDTQIANELKFGVKHWKFTTWQIIEGCSHAFTCEILKISPKNMSFF